VLLFENFSKKRKKKKAIIKNNTQKEALFRGEGKTKTKQNKQRSTKPHTKNRKLVKQAGCWKKVSRCLIETKKSRATRYSFGVLCV